MTFFYSQQPFLGFIMVFFCRGGQIHRPNRSGGAKILTFQQIHSAIITLSALEGGPNSIANFDGGAMAGFAPPLDPNTSTNRPNYEYYRCVDTAYPEPY